MATSFSDDKHTASVMKFPEEEEQQEFSPTDSKLKDSKSENTSGLRIRSLNQSNDVQSSDIPYSKFKFTPKESKSNNKGTPN